MIHTIAALDKTTSVIYSKVILHDVDTERESFFPTIFPDYVQLKVYTKTFVFVYFITLILKIRPIT